MPASSLHLTCSKMVFDATAFKYSTFSQDEQKKSSIFHARSSWDFPRPRAVIENTLTNQWWSNLFCNQTWHTSEILRISPCQSCAKPSKITKCFAFAGTSCNTRPSSSVSDFLICLLNFFSAVEAYCAAYTRYWILLCIMKPRHNPGSFEVQRKGISRGWFGCSRRTVNKSYIFSINNSLFQKFLLFFVFVASVNYDFRALHNQIWAC